MQFVCMRALLLPRLTIFSGRYANDLGINEVINGGGLPRGRRMPATSAYHVQISLQWLLRRMFPQLVSSRRLYVLNAQSCSFFAL